MQNKLKNIIIVIINLTSIITRSVTKTLKSLIIKNVNTSWIKVEKTEKETFKEDEKNLINNVVIQQLRRNDARIVYKIKKVLKSSFSLLTAKIKKFQNKNFVVNCVRSQLQSSQKRNDCVERKWHVKKKLLYFFHVIYVLKKVALKTKLLRLHHNNFLANHFEIKKIRVLMQKKFSWFKMTKNIKKYVKDCDMCQRIKTSRHRFYDEFSSLSVSTRSWTKISMNFITKFLSSRYDDDIYDAILIIIDCFLKITHYIFAKST